MKAMADPKMCTACGACVDACPVHTIEVRENTAVVGENCAGWGLCEQECTSGAITMAEN